MNPCIVLSGFVLIHFSTVAYAQNCDHTSRPSFNFQNEEADLNNAIYEVDAGWRGKWKDLPAAERLKQQEAVIAKISADYVKKHSASQRKGSCVVGLTNMCPPPQGNNRSCATGGRIGPRQQDFSASLENRSGDVRSDGDY